MSIQAKAAIADGKGSFTIETIEVHPPKRDEVLVAIKASGVCHTDYDSLNWGVDAGEIDYVSLHGTSTQLNDRIETRAVKRVFGSRATSIPASSLKSMIGHPQGACGAAGVCASLLAMRDQFVPPTINRDEPDPECDLDVVPQTGRPARLRTVLCNCIGFGSKNSSLVFRALDA